MTIGKTSYVVEGLTAQTVKLSRLKRGKGEGGRQGIISQTIIALSSTNKYNGKSISQTVKTSFVCSNIHLHMGVALFSGEEEVIEWCHISCGQPQKKGEEGWSEDFISLVTLWKTFNE